MAPSTSDTISRYSAGRDMRIMSTDDKKYKPMMWARNRTMLLGEMTCANVLKSYIIVIIIVVIIIV